MKAEAIRALFREAIDYVDQGIRSGVSHEIELRCGHIGSKLAVSEILIWLEYLHRGGRQRESWPVRQGPMLNALVCILEPENRFSELFYVQDARLAWRSDGGHDIRRVAVRFVGLNWTPGIVEEHRLVAVTDAAGGQHTLVRDKAGWPRAWQDPDGSLTTYECWRLQGLGDRHG